MEIEVVELKIRLHCKSCEKAVRKALCKIKGVRCVEIDVRMNKMTILLGYGEHVDRNVIIKALRKTGTRAEPFWPSSSPSSHHRHHHPQHRHRSSSASGFRCIIPYPVKWAL